MSFTNARIIGSNVPYAAYRSDVQRGDKSFPMSRSELCAFLECPEKWVEGAKKETNASMDWGSLVDILVLTPDQFNKRYIVAPATYQDSKGKVKPWTYKSDTCQKWRDDREAEGFEVIKQDTAQAAEQAKSRLLKDPEIREIIEKSEKQVMCEATYQDDDTGIGVPLRILIDLLPPVDMPEVGRSIIDLKTVANAHPRTWRRAVFDFNWHVQAALYLDIYSAARPLERDTFRHIIQESEPPFTTAKRYMEGNFVTEGRTAYRTALAHYCQCLHAGTWTGWDTYQMDAYAGWGVTKLEAWMISARNDWPVARIIEA